LRHCASNSSAFGCGTALEAVVQLVEHCASSSSAVG